MFEYLEDPSPFLVEINRILKPDGILLFTCYNSNCGSIKSFIKNLKLVRAGLKPILKAIRDALSPRPRSINTKYYGHSTEERERLYKKVAHTPRQISEFLSKKDLRLITYRAFGFKISDKTFRAAQKLQYKMLQNNIIIFSAFLNRLCGLLPLIKNKGGVLIIKARKS